MKTTPAGSTSLLPRDHQPTHTMSDAEVKNDVAEAPSAEDLKAKKRSAEVNFSRYFHRNFQLILHNMAVKSKIHPK